MYMTPEQQGLYESHHKAFGSVYQYQSIRFTDIHVYTTIHIYTPPPPAFINDVEVHYNIYTYNNTAIRIVHTTHIIPRVYLYRC